MRILILGGDGYLGWPTAMQFSNRGHEVHVVDNYLRRRAHAGGRHRLAHADRRGLPERVAAWHEVTGKDIGVTEGDLTRLGRRRAPSSASSSPRRSCTTARCPRRPYSMIDREHAVFTQTNNVVNTLNVLFAIAAFAPDAHLVKLGTMGEYGTPNIDIEEGYIEIEHNGRTDRCRSRSCPAASTTCRRCTTPTTSTSRAAIWGLRATDLNQGVVYGIETEETDARRPARDAVRLRRGLRHGAQPLLRPGRDRPPAHRVRQGRPDARLPEHRRHAAVRRAGRD